MIVRTLVHCLLVFQKETIATYLTAANTMTGKMVQGYHESLSMDDEMTIATSIPWKVQPPPAISPRGCCSKRAAMTQNPNLYFNWQDMTHLSTSELSIFFHQWVLRASCQEVQTSVGEPTCYDCCYESNASVNSHPRILNKHPHQDQHTWKKQFSAVTWIDGNFFFGFSFTCERFQNIFPIAASWLCCFVSGNRIPACSSNSK